MSKNQNPYTILNVNYPCPRCKLEFKQTAELYQHIREIHPSPKRCHICGHHFDAFASLLSHSYLHSGAKPFKCGYPDCDYSTRTKQNIQVHMHFCPQCPENKYRERFPLPDRYKSSYKYQHTITQHKQIRKQNSTKSRPKSRSRSRAKLNINTPKKAHVQNGSDTMQKEILQVCYSPKKTRAWYSNNSEYENPADILMKTPPTKRFIKTGKLIVEKENVYGWILEMHKCITTKSQIVCEAIKLISSQLTRGFVGAQTQPKGLHVACLRDNNNEIQCAAIINKKDDGNHIEIKSFATASKHKRQNLGTLLIAFILERCNGKIIIGARNDFGVLQFWRSIGFIECQQGAISTFGRINEVMMQTIAPYFGIYEYALNKFAPNSIVKNILFIDKRRNKKENTIEQVRFSLVARYYENKRETVNDENKEQVNAQKNLKRNKRKLPLSNDNDMNQPPLKRVRRYHTRYSVEK